MNNKQLAELKAAANLATPGPWQIGEFDSDDVVNFSVNNLIEGNNCGIAFTTDMGTTKDAKYIALANPSTVLALLARLEDAESALKEISHTFQAGREPNFLAMHYRTLASNYFAKHGGAR